MLQNLGRYKIVGELGRGGCGIVYRALDPSIGRTVAIKTIQVDDDSPEGAAALRSRFRREARSAGSLSHPNIVTIHEFNDSGDPMFIAMEFIDGQTLAKAMGGGKLPVEFILKVLRSAADALDYAHAHNIVHRDVKPANFLIDKSGHVKIADFGVAKLLDSADAQTNLTSTGMVVGTAQYISPEQISEERVTGRSDQFSLAVIAYEMLTGVKPFQGNSWATFLHAIMMTEPPPVTKYCEGLTETVNGVLKKGLSKTPDGRYGTCREFCDALEQALIAGGFSGRTASTGSFPAGLNTEQFTERPAILSDRFAKARPKRAMKASRLKLVAIGSWVALAILGAWLGFRLKWAPAKARVAIERPAVKQPAAAANSAEPPASPPAPLPQAVAKPVPSVSEPTSKTPAKEAVRESAKAEPARVIAKALSPAANTKELGSAPAATVQKTLEQPAASTPASGASSVPVMPPAQAPPPPKPAEEDQVKRLADEPIKRDAEEQSKRLADDQTRRAAEEQTKRLSDLQAKAALEEKTKNARTADFQAISRALMDYQTAYQRKDPAALQTIWPSIPKTILDGIRDSFRDASEVNMEVHSVGDPEISGNTATVTCGRNLRQVIRKKVLQASNRVRIVLNRRGSGWVIQSIEAVN